LKFVAETRNLCCPDPYTARNGGARAFGKETQMRRSSGTRIVFGGVVLALGAAVGVASFASAAKPEQPSGPSCPATVPAALNPPADATLAASFGAQGVQVYVCAAPAAGGAPAWTLKAPHAVLSQGNEVAAIHFAGPTWQAVDGSSLTAAKVAADPGPDAKKAVPWLLLKASGNTGTGLFGDVTFVQRLATEGGVAPAGGCDAAHLNAQVLVPYRADYFFYHPAVAGKKPRQCASH
jgi:hypothetical protein